MKSKQPKSRQATAEIQRSWNLYSIGLAALLVFITFQAYGPALHGPFVLDDLGLPYYNPRFETERFASWISGVRPLLMLSFWGNFQLSGRDTFWYHVVNVLLHLLNGGLVYFIVRRILGRREQDTTRRDLASAAAALLFLLHPVQTESVAYIASRSETLSGVFFLAAFALFLYRGPGELRWRRSLAILVLFACALATKEHTVVLPVLLVLTEVWWFSPNPLTAIRRDWRLYLPMLAGAVVSAALILRILKHSTSAGLSIAGVGDSLSYFFTECRVFLLYVKLYLFPVGQTIDYDTRWSRSPFEAGTLIGAAVIAALIFIAWHWRRRYPVSTYGLAVFLLLLAPTSSIVALKDPVAEHRLYLPLLGLVLISADVLLRWVRGRTQVAAVAIAGALILLASVATYRRNLLWGSEAALWQDAVDKAPNKQRGYEHLVHGLVQQRRCAEALKRLDDLSKRETLEPILYVHWAFAYECVHQPEQAVEKLKQAAAQLPDASIYMNMARNLAVLGRFPEALDALNRAVQLDPNLEPAFVARGELRQREGNVAAAVQDYQRALALNPGDAVARQLLNVLENAASARESHFSGATRSVRQ